MAIASTTIAEVRAGGSATLGAGFFDPGQTAGMFTDGAATSATSSAPVFSSASYNFVAGDVGAWVFIASGSNWIPGWYKIASVGSNVATLNAGVGTATLLSSTSRPFGLSTVVGAAATASPTGATWSIDYSQQDASAVTYTDLASAGAGLTASSAANPLGKQHVGNSIVITGGTNFTTGRYVLASVDGSFIGTFVGPTNITTGVGASGTGRLGGGVAKLNDIGTLIVAGNYIFVTGSFSLGASDGVSISGNAVSPIKVVGYNAVRGDGYLGNLPSGGLITTNMPTLTYASTFLLSATGAYTIWENLNIIGSRSGAMMNATGTPVIMIRCKVVNSSTNIAAVAVNTTGSGATHIECNYALTGASGASGALVTGTLGRIIGCRISGGPNIGINLGSSSIALNNVIYNCLGIGIAGTAVGGTSTIVGNTIYACSGDGINITGASSQLHVIVGNHVTDGSSYGINLSATSGMAILAYNRSRDNFSGITNLGGDWVVATNYGVVTGDGGDAFSDYIAPASGDFRLRDCSPSKYAGLPYPTSIGALQTITLPILHRNRKTFR